MFHHQMSLKMKQKTARNCCRFQRQFLNILMLSIMWTMMIAQTMARPNIDTLLFNQPTYDLEEQRQQQQQQREVLYLDDVLTNTIKEKLFNKMVNIWSN